MPRCTEPHVNAYRIAAIIVSGGRLVAVGRNSRKTSPVVARLAAMIGGRDGRRNCLHAELDALGRSPIHARGAVMYVARVHADGVTANSQPCPICQMELRRCGIRRAFYTTADGGYDVMDLLS